MRELTQPELVARKPFVSPRYLAGSRLFSPSDAFAGAWSQYANDYGCRVYQSRHKSWCGGLVTVVFLLRRRFDSGNSSSSRTDNTSQRTSSNVGRALKDTAMQTARMLRQDAMRCLSSWLANINKQNFGLISLLRRCLVLRNVLLGSQKEQGEKGR